MNPSMPSVVFALALWEICDFAPEDKHKTEQTMAAAEISAMAESRNVRKRAKFSIPK